MHKFKYYKRSLQLISWYLFGLKFRLFEFKGLKDAVNKLFSSFLWQVITNVDSVVEVLVLVLNLQEFLLPWYFETFLIRKWDLQRYGLLLFED